MNAVPFRVPPRHADAPPGDELARLEAMGAIRVVRPVDLDAIVDPDRPAAMTGEVRIVGVADTETTGIAPSSSIIELALRRLKVDRDGSIVEIGRPYSFLEDPGEPLSPTIQRLTGLHDEDLVGRRIDDALATALLRSCSVVVCHNAGFDAGRIVERLPALVGLPFACSMREIDWRARGHAGPLTLGCLLCGHGLYNAHAHRAGSDVDATVSLLAQRDAGGRTALGELLETAGRPTFRFSAYGAGFGRPKDRLKERGYRWDAVAKVWSREVPAEGERAEADWLRTNVYAPELGARCDGPHVETVDWGCRYA